VPTPRKTLYHFAIRDRTFLARRHGHLLVEEPLVDEPRLRELQQAYRAEVSLLERAAIARQFERIVHETEDEILEQAFRELPRVVVTMPKRRKSLTARVLDGSFQRRHGYLLDEEELEPLRFRGVRATAVWARLCRLQEQYRLARPEAVKLRRSLADDFAAASRELPAGRKPKALA
jgi:hypothetical protein